jgi:hypothetical protein
MRLPLTLIIASSRPTEAEQAVLALDDRVARPDRGAAASPGGAGLKRSAVRSGSFQ